MVSSTATASLRTLKFWIFSSFLIKLDVGDYAFGSKNVKTISKLKRSGVLGIWVCEFLIGLDVNDYAFGSKNVKTIF